MDFGENFEIIPSETINEFHKEIGHKFSDREHAMLACQRYGDIPIDDILQALTKMMFYTKDAELKKDIEDLEFWKSYIDRYFASGGDDVVYMLKAEFQFEPRFYQAFDLAMEAGRQCGTKFSITRVRAFNKADVNMNDSEIIWYQANGKAMLMRGTHTNQIVELYLEKWKKYDSGVVMCPHPFKIGDFVRDIYENKLGIVWERTDTEVQSVFFITDISAYLDENVKAYHLELVTEEDMREHPNWNLIEELKNSVYGNINLGRILSIKEQSKNNQRYEIEKYKYKIKAGALFQKEREVINYRRLVPD